MPGINCFRNFERKGKMADLERMTSWDLARHIADKLIVYRGHAKAYEPLSLPFYQSAPDSWERREGRDDFHCSLLNDLAFSTTETSPRYGQPAYEKILEKTGRVVTEMEQFSGVELDPEDYMRFLAAREIQTPYTHHEETEGIVQFIETEFDEFLQEQYGKNTSEFLEQSIAHVTTPNEAYVRNEFVSKASEWLTLARESQFLPNNLCPKLEELEQKLSERRHNADKHHAERAAEDNKGRQRTALTAEAVRRVAETKDVEQLRKLAACFGGNEGKEGFVAVYSSASDVEIQTLLGAIDASFDEQHIESSGLDYQDFYRSYKSERNPVEKAFYGLQSLLFLTHSQIPSLAEKARNGAMEAFVLETVVAPDFKEIQEAVSRFSVEYADDIQRDMGGYARQIRQQYDGSEERLQIAAEELSELAAALTENLASDLKAGDFARLTRKFDTARSYFDQAKERAAVATPEQFEALATRAATIADHGRRSLKLTEAFEAQPAASVEVRRLEA
ncbi:MAG: hypothetical protein KDJ15_06970 [Alphaproteobacteria bacterium]|nr:hypothetical protein [Alphaproteobacteria bacterium]